MVGCYIFRHCRVCDSPDANETIYRNISLLFSKKFGKKQLQFLSEFEQLWRNEFYPYDGQYQINLYPIILGREKRVKK